MAGSSASSARGIATGAAFRSSLTRHTRADSDKRPVASANAPSVSGGETAHGRHTRAETVGTQGPRQRYSRAVQKHTTDTRRRVVCVGWYEARFTWRGNRTRSAHKGRYIGTLEPIPSSHKGRVTLSAHKKARGGRDVLTDVVELCIECTSHCHGDSFPKLADQAHKSRYCRHARAESHGRHTGRREWEGSS